MLSSNSLSIVKTNELLRLLRDGGCEFLRHGANHDIWINPKTGARSAVPGHGAQEVKIKTAKAILSALLD